MGGSWHALDGGMGVFIRKSLPTRQGETVDRAHERERERGGREGGVKSGSPCTACASKTRSSFLHLQVERRDIRHGLHHPTFSICDNVSSPLFPPFSALLSSLLLSASSLPRKLEIVPETVWETNGYKRWWITTLLFVSFIGWWFFFSFFLNGTFQLAAMIHHVTLFIRIGNS